MIYHFLLWFSFLFLLNQILFHSNLIFFKNTIIIYQVLFHLSFNHIFNMLFYFINILMSFLNLNLLIIILLCLIYKYKIQFQLNLNYHFLSHIIYIMVINIQCHNSHSLMYYYLIIHKWLKPIIIK